MKGFKFMVMSLTLSLSTNASLPLDVGENMQARVEADGIVCAQNLVPGIGGMKEVEETILVASLGNAGLGGGDPLKGKNDLYCDAARNYNWERFKRIVSSYGVSISAALKNMNCDFKDKDGKERSNGILYLIASEKEDGIQGIFTWDMITHLENDSQISMLVDLINGTENSENIFKEIEDAKVIAGNNDKVVEELVEMKRSLCLTIRKHKIKELKENYIDNCTI